MKKYILGLGNISGDFSVNNMKKTGWKRRSNGWVYEFFVDYRAFNTIELLILSMYINI